MKYYKQKCIEYTYWVDEKQGRYLYKAMGDSCIRVGCACKDIESEKKEYMLIEISEEEAFERML